MTTRPDLPPASGIGATWQVRDGTRPPILTTLGAGFLTPPSVVLLRPGVGPVLQTLAASD